MGFEQWSQLINGVVEVIQRLAIVRVPTQLTGDIGHLPPQVSECVTLDVLARKRAARKLSHDGIPADR